MSIEWFDYEVLMMMMILERSDLEQHPSFFYSSPSTASEVSMTALLLLRVIAPEPKLERLLWINPILLTLGFPRQCARFGEQSSLLRSAQLSQGQSYCV